MSSRQRLSIYSATALFTMLIIAVAASSMEATSISGSSIAGSGNSSAVPQSANQCISVPILLGCFQWQAIFGIDSDFSLHFGQLHTLFALALLISVAIGSVMLIFWATGDGTVSTPSVDESTPKDSDFAAQDSNSATCSGPKPTSEVERAWWEIVRLADLPRWRSRTPSEVETAAIDAGLDPEIVTEVTTLFKAVRYGDRPLTDDIEQQASTALLDLAPI